MPFTIWCFTKLNKGADGACGDDAAGLKTAVVVWLMHGRPTLELILEPHKKTGRGFYHDATARLICPVDYNWSNVQYVYSPWLQLMVHFLMISCTRHRANIRNFHPDYLVTADSWPHFVYKNDMYDPKDPVKGLFKNAMLMKVGYDCTLRAMFLTIP